MGLFDKISTDGTGNIGVFTQQAKAFATLDLNSIIKMAGAGIVDLINNALKTFHALFDRSNCNDQDRVLVERFTDQIPGMGELLSDLGYYDSSIGDEYRAHENDPGGIAHIMTEMGRPHGAHPCNELIGPARLMFTILFGVRITNSNFLDALEQGVDAYYASGGWTLNDIPRNAVERAVSLRQQFFPGWTYNNKQWDLNIFQNYPLVAPIPDPFTPGQLYTGEFMGVNVVNGMAIGDPIPDVQEYVSLFDRLRKRGITLVQPGTYKPIPISELPDFTKGSPTTTTTTPTPTPTTTTTTTTPASTTGSGGLLTWAKAHPLETVGIIALVTFVTVEIIDHHKK